MIYRVKHSFKVLNSHLVSEGGAVLKTLVIIVAEMKIKFKVYKVEFLVLSVVYSASPS